jgi:hypothetical protein
LSIALIAFIISTITVTVVFKNEISELEAQIDELNRMTTPTEETTTTEDPEITDPPRPVCSRFFKTLLR